MAAMEKKNKKGKEVGRGSASGKPRITLPFSAPPPAVASLANTPKSETGYHVHFKCTETEIKDKVKRKLSSLQQHSTILEKQLSSATDNYKWRKLLDDYSNQGLRNQSYIAYKSCVPVDGEEKLSVLGFEAPGSWFVHS